MTDQATLAANTLSTNTYPDEDRLQRLERLVEHQSRQIGALNQKLQQQQETPQKVQTERDRERELPYRFEAGPKWLLESGWREQSNAHRKAWPVLWRVLELECWPGSPVRITHDQLADHIGVSTDTAKRRLRWLQEQGVVEIMPGSGRRPSTVAVHHPIATPIPYAEVSWAAGGMYGAPGGYLQELAGPKRYYAELYGVELPEPEPVPVEEEAPLVEEPPEEPGPEHSAKGGQFARAGGAVCPPSETNESNAIPDSSPPDAGARTRPGERRGENRKKTQISEVEARIKTIPPDGVSEDAGHEARHLVEALDAYDTRTATKAGQLAALALREDGENGLLREVCKRIQSARERTQVRIVVPTRYAICVWLQVRQERALTDAETELARRVLDSPSRTQTSTQQGENQRGDEGQSSKERHSFREGYEWLFEKSTGARNQSTADAKGPISEQQEQSQREAEVAELFERSDEDGERMRRLALRVQEGKLSEEILAERVAEVLDGDPYAERRYRRAVTSILVGTPLDMSQNDETNSNNNSTDSEEG